jgi:hypothetical protein
MTTPLHHAERLRDLATRGCRDKCRMDALMAYGSMPICSCGAEKHNHAVQAAFEQLRDARPSLPLEAIECGIECIQMLKEKELLDAAKHRARGHVMNEVSCEHAAQSLQKYIDALQSLLPQGPTK